RHGEAFARARPGDVLLRPARAVVFPRVGEVARCTEPAEEHDAPGGERRHRVARSRGGARDVLLRPAHALGFPPIARRLRPFAAKEYDVSIGERRHRVLGALRRRWRELALTPTALRGPFPRVAEVRESIAAEHHDCRVKNFLAAA